MSLLKKLFGSADPLAPVRKALQQNRWSDALVIGDTIDRASLDVESAAELDRLLVAAGDGLAELNLTEGEGCLRSGDGARAGEHFALAAAQARSEALSQRIADAQKRLASSPEPPSAPPSKAGHGCGASCSSSGATGHPKTHDSTAPGELDPTTRLELILATYPAEWASSYTHAGEMFKEAFLLAHECNEAEALERFSQIPEAERSDLFYFERGALLGRLGEVERGCRDLEKALVLNPGHLLAMETLITLEISSGQETAAQQRLEKMLRSDTVPAFWAFCHGCLATLCARRGDFDAALQHGQMAIEAGSREPELILLVASLLEQVGRLDDAESLLQTLPGGGCSGGISVPLAEFWLRQERNLTKVLEAFKGALRQEPGQSRWALRIAQTYLARGWKKDGIALLEKVLADPHLDTDLRREGESLLHSLR